MARISLAAAAALLVTAIPASAQQAPHGSGWKKNPSGNACFVRPGNESYWSSQFNLNGQWVVICNKKYAESTNQGVPIVEGQLKGKELIVGKYRCRVDDDACS